MPTHAARAGDPYPGLLDAMGQLWGLSEAKLSGGAYTKAGDNVVRERNLSRYSIYKGKQDGTIAMGIVQAILALLAGCVRDISCDPTVQTGRLTIASTSGPETYHMSWDERSGDHVFGGFIYRATYHSAVVGFTMLFARQWLLPTPDDELTERWWRLQAELERVYPRPVGTHAWSRSQIGAACQDVALNDAIRDAIAALADSLYLHLRYAIPDTTVERATFVQWEVGLAPDEGSAIGIAADTLLARPGGLGRLPATGGEAAERDSDLDLDLGEPDTEDGAGSATDGAESAAAAKAEAPASAGTETRTGDGPRSLRDRASGGRSGTATTGVSPAPGEAAGATPSAPSMPPSPPGSPATRRRARTPAGGVDVDGDVAAAAEAAEAELRRTAPGLVANETVAYVERAWRRPGPFFLVGESATGKTHCVEDVALRLGDGYELIKLAPGIKDEHLFGTYIRRAGEWIWVDGVVARWARRAAAGERVALILDELPRADPSVTDGGLLPILDTYSAEKLAAQRLAVPPGQPGPFHVVRIPDTEEAIIVPAERGKIAATGNQGESYRGVSIDDPAVVSRFTGGWKHIGRYQRIDLCHILARHLLLAPEHALLDAMAAVDEALHAYQARPDVTPLRLTTNLRVLITWGHEIRRLCGAGTSLRASFIQAAEDLWIDMVTPYNGDVPDPEVKRMVTKVVGDRVPAGRL
jgi:hypothetical protein